MRGMRNQNACKPKTKSGGDFADPDMGSFKQDKKLGYHTNRDRRKAAVYGGLSAFSG